MKITIPAGKTLEKDVVLNEGLELQEIVVGGAFQGQRRAINAQKTIWESLMSFQPTKSVNSPTLISEMR